MKMMKCEKEHIYDADKFDSCPHCANLEAGAKVSNILGEKQADIETMRPKAMQQQNYSQSLKRNTTGWLVCVKGEMKGESFVLREGENAIGRAAHMDVSLAKESTVSRNHHAMIVYEKPATFRLEPTQEVYCNGKLCEQPQMPKAKDQIQLGECELLFVPLCDETFSW